MKRIVYALGTGLFLYLSTAAQVNITTAVDFTVTDIKGQSHNLFGYLNAKKWVVIDFTLLN